MSQTEVATNVGISRNYLSMIEHDLANNLSVIILVRLAAVLQIDECQLLKSYVAGLGLEIAHEIEGFK